MALHVAAKTMLNPGWQAADMIEMAMGKHRAERIAYINLGRLMVEFVSIAIALERTAVDE